MESVVGIRQRTPDDHAHCVIKVAAAHLVFEIDGENFFGEFGHVRSLWPRSARSDFYEGNERFITRVILAQRALFLA